MSLATRIYNELTGYDDPDAYAPPLIVSIIVLLCLVPWKRIFRTLGFVVLIWIGLIILAL